MIWLAPSEARGAAASLDLVRPDRLNSSIPWAGGAGSDARGACHCTRTAAGRDSCDPPLSLSMVPFPSLRRSSALDSSRPVCPYSASQQRALSRLGPHSQRSALGSICRELTCSPSRESCTPRTRHIRGDGGLRGQGSGPGKVGCAHMHITFDLCFTHSQSHISHFLHTRAFFCCRVIPGRRMNTAGSHEYEYDYCDLAVFIVMNTSKV